MRTKKNNEIKTGTVLGQDIEVHIEGFENNSNNNMKAITRL